MAQRLYCTNFDVQVVKGLLAHQSTAACGNGPIVKLSSYFDPIHIYQDEYRLRLSGDPL